MGFAMKYTGFLNEENAWHDCEGDMPWPEIMALLDLGDTAGVGALMQRHIASCKEALEAEGTGESIYAEEERLDRRDRARECNRGFGR